MADLATLIMNQARKTGADPYTLLATAMVESNLNPNAVGDGGTSYGLFQMHVGGAGGRTHDEARRYLDPMTAVENRARHFRGGSGGAFAASVQRPANAAEYARKVDAVIAQLKAGKMPKGSIVKLNAPVASGGVTGGSTDKSAALSLIFGDDPIFALAGKANTTPTRRPKQQANTGGFGWSMGKEKGSYKDLMRRGKKFGLGVQSESQTTGGKHSPNSYHYQQRAVDFGDATNSREDLMRFAQYVRQNPGEFTEFYYTPAGFSVKDGQLLEGHTIGGHSDHVHVARSKPKRSKSVADLIRSPGKFGGGR